MKTTILFSLLLLTSSLRNVSATEFSQTNQGIYIAISGSSTNEPIAFNDRLVWRPFCNASTGEAELNYPDSSYGIRITMLDASKKPVSKTKLGNSFGAKFYQVHTYQDVISAPHEGYYSGHIGSINAQGEYDASEGVSGPLLPAPNDLFQMDKSGTYVLEIQMQMFLIHKNTNQWTRELIRFSPIKIQVSKSSDTK